MNRVIYKINKRRERRQALRFVKNTISNGGVDIRFNSTPVELIPECEDYVDSYNIYPKDKQFLETAPKWFDKQITVISLVKTDGAFFTDYTLEFNHKEFEVPERQVRWLYDQAQALKTQISQKEKVM